MGRGSLAVRCVQLPHTPRTAWCNATAKSVGVDGDSEARGERVKFIELKKAVGMAQMVAGSFQA